jgi:alkylation response protein AidB-like acyl-CoA dehydrogenase
MTNLLTRDEISKNDTEESLWCIIDHKVYDLTDFLDAHPGGTVVLRQIAGTDATTAFFNLHRYEVLKKYSRLCIGDIKGEKSEVREPELGDLSKVPYAEPLWLNPSFRSPYYTESHRRLQNEMRVFVDKDIYPEAQEKEIDGTYISQHLIDKMSRNNLIGMHMGPGKHLHGRKLMGCMRGEDFDYFHDLVVTQELTRCRARGFHDGIMGGLMISLTAVQNWLKNKELRDTVIEECLSGQKKICLAISEAFAGSDVAGIKTRAIKTADGKSYIVNGTKKWITNGMFCDYFVAGCRTAKGLSVLLIRRDNTISTKKIKTSYSTAAGTAYVEFDNTIVPVSHLLGEEDNGFSVIMSNFNHERWAITAASVAWGRMIVEECLKWSNQRIVADKPLVSLPVIRQK